MPTTLDPEALDRVLRVGGIDLLRRLVRVAGDNIRDRLATLRAALAATPPDFDSAGHAAHSLKSSAAYVGALALAEIAAGIERRALEPDRDVEPAALAIALGREADIYEGHLEGVFSALGALVGGADGATAD